MANYFNKGFNLVYYSKVHCPVCKEEIYANAVVCPNCKTDFTQSRYRNRNEWQKGAMKIVLIISFMIGLAIYLGEAPIVLCFLAGFATYGFGLIIVQKIQSFQNYHYK